MSLRDMTVDIGFNADASPLNKMNKAMNDFAGTTNKAAREMSKMSKFVDIAYAGMIDESKAFVNQFSRQSDVIRKLARDSGMSAIHLAEAWSDMSTDMRKSLIQNHNQMRQFRKDLLESEFEMRKLGMQMGHYTGTTDDFMSEIQKLGKAHKKISDQMINSNLSMRQGMIQSIATMSAMSGQSDKITKIYDRMGSSILKINNPLLAVTSHMEKMVRAGNAAQLALKMLGPNAKMKDLQDTISVINQGIMRQQAVLAIAGAAWLGFTAIVAHASLGPDPDKVKQQEANLTKIYRDAWNQRVNEISNFVGLFEKVSVPKVNGSELIKALQSQLNAIRTWRTNLQGLVKKGVDDGLIKELQKAGPAAAGQVKALNNMSRPELNKYVSLWREKMGLARTQATDELTKLREETRKKIQDLQNSLTPLGKSWERFKSTFASAFQPFVSLWGNIASHVVDAVTSVGNFINSINKLNPNVTKLVGMFAYLFVGLTMILSPLAVGIGLFGGFQAALAGTWALIGPFVTGFAAVAGTAALVSAAIVGVGYALYYAWNHSETFRNGVISAWNAIKTKAQEVWGFISPYINQVISAVVGFVQSKMNALKMFWSQNGASILQAAHNIWTPIRIVVTAVMNAIWAVMKFVWPIVLALIKSVWGNIKGVINGALNIIMGLVKIFAGLFTLNFSQMWSGIKQVFFGAIQFIWNYIQLMMFGRVLSAGKAFIVSLKNVFVALWSGARTIFIGGINAIRAFVVGGFNGLKNASMSILKSLSSGVRAIWNGLRSGLSGIVSRIVSGIKSGWNSARSFTVSIFSGIKNFVSKTFTDIVNGAKALPGKIGAGIKSMAGKAMSGVKHLANTLVGGLAQGVNGVIGGVNWVLGKIGVKSRIPTWPPPKYANGTDGHPGGLAFVGDGRGSNAGPELIRMPSGQVGLSPSTTTLVNLPKGTEVLPAKQTRALLNSGIAPAYAGGIGSKIKNVAINVWEGTKNIASKAAGAVKAVASKVKDVGLDIWSYVSNPSKLMKKVYEQFIPSLPSISGSFGTILKGSMSVVKDKAISYVKEKLAIADNPPGNDVQRWKATVIRALGMNGLPTTPAYVNAWLKQIATESGGNAKAIQSMAVNDINARTGNLARGLVQVIPPTFNAFKFKGFGNIMRGLDNLLAGINYAKHRYGVKGMLSVIGKGHGYAKGTNYHPGGIAMVGDGVGSNSGAELFRLPNGVLGLTPQKPTLMNLPRGTQVVPAKETREILSNSAVTSSIDSHLITKSSVLKENVNSVPAYASGIGDWFQITTGNSWSNTETGDSNSSSVYSPSTNTAGAKNTVFTYSPKVDIHIDGNVDDNTRQNLKDEFQIMLNEHYKKLLDLFGPEEVV